MHLTNSDTSHAIALNNVVYRYSSSDHDAVIDIPEWKVSKGQRLFLQGASGSGKTTLLNLLAGILVPKQGNIDIMGQAFSSLSSRRRDKFRAAHIGVVFQQFNLIPFLSVLKNVQTAAHFGPANVDDVENRLGHMMAKLDLSPELMHRRASELSVGQQQRVAIARSLINTPDILLVDEPTSALDASARDAFMELLISLCDSSDATLIFVSHDAYLGHCFEQIVHLEELNRARGVKP